MRWAARTYKLEDNSAIIRDLLPARNGVPGPSTTLGFEHAGQEGSPLGLNPLCNFVSFVVDEIRTTLSCVSQERAMAYLGKLRESTIGFRFL